MPKLIKSEAEEEFESMLTDLLHLVHFRLLTGGGGGVARLAVLDGLLERVADEEEFNDEKELVLLLLLAEEKDAFCIGCGIGLGEE